MRLIDADALLEDYNLKNATKYGNKNAEQQHKSHSTMMMYEIADMIEDTPTVEPNQWIPCSERLPEENGHYLVTYHCKSYGNYLPLFDDTYVRRMRFQNGTWMYPRNIDKEAEVDEFKEVIAWMNLPPIYEN